MADPFFRFYFRFIAPFHDYLPFDTNTVRNKIEQELRSFVGQTTFEELSQQWVIQQGKDKKLPFSPDLVGSHWSRGVQVDVVAVHWESCQILLGESKWGQEKVNREQVCELLEQKTIRLKKTLPDEGKGWEFHYAVFSRSGFTAAALNALRAHGGLAIDLQRLDADLK